ncbi:PucR family transcriptional regulator ligand-binding domain-containing protein [Streptomyces sp. Q6]|uniref:PucR family transcriptional regulator ligand-binding domain-containing protein n=1 Tax=Streptomyces citrinus TaxID=3118173 RepID=A0ACD5ACK4_9ACTN
MPALTLREILALDVVADASPELLAGDGALDRPVRWVHSSEVYEGAGFLDGGELLLTNGFAFLGADEGALRLYVRELAARGVAGLAVEVGRSLERMPREVVAAARELGFPLVALRRVVPFVRIAEAANRAIVAHGLAARAVPHVRDADQGAALLADLADGQPSTSRRCRPVRRSPGSGPGPGRGSSASPCTGRARSPSRRWTGSRGAGCCGRRSPAMCSRCSWHRPAGTPYGRCATRSARRPSRA